VGYFYKGEIIMSYNILVEWATSKRGFEALRNQDPRLGTFQEKALEEAIIENAEDIFKANQSDNEHHTGKASRDRFEGDFYNDDAVATFKAEVEKAVGPGIWNQLYSFEVTGEVVE
jgi:hypothetical protein